MPARNPRTFSRIETGSATLNESGVATVTFSSAFKHTPVIVIAEYNAGTPNDTTALLITAASRTAFTVKASAGYEVGETVYYHVIG
jgi:hypothetical protein